MRNPKQRADKKELQMKRTPPEALYTFRGSMSPVHCLLPVISSCREVIYAGTGDGNVHVWDLQSKREVGKHKVGSEPCLSIVLKDQLFLTQLKGDCIKFWKEENDKWILKKIISSEYCGFCEMAMIGDILYLPDNDSGIIIHDPSKNKDTLVQGKRELGQVMCLKGVSSSECILAAYESGDIYCWNSKLDEITSSKFSSHCPMALEYCDKTGEGLIGTVSKSFYKFKLTGGKEGCWLRQVTEGRLTNEGVGCVAINSAGSLAVLGCWDGRIRYVAMRSLSLLAVLPHHSQTVQAITFIDKNLSFFKTGLLIAGGKDSRISLWDLYAK